MIKIPIAEELSAKPIEAESSGNAVRTIPEIDRKIPRKKRGWRISLRSPGKKIKASDAENTIDDSSKIEATPGSRRYTPLTKRN
jgi:hypothetical protein